MIQKALKNQAFPKNNPNFIKKEAQKTQKHKAT
jgi:hypothetical protein